MKQKKHKPHIVIYYYKTNAEEAAVSDMTVDGKHIDKLSHTCMGAIDMHNEYAMEDLQELVKEKRVNVSLQEVDEDGADAADFAYATQDHGCNSFDEYIERCNFPEDYE